MRPSMPSILLCMLLSCLLASWSYAASAPKSEMPPDFSIKIPPQPKITNDFSIKIPPQPKIPSNVVNLIVPPQSKIPSSVHVITSEIGELRVYPDTLKNHVYPGEAVVFEFTPTVDNIQVADLRIDTGETGIPALGCGHTQPPCKEGQTVRAMHKYAKEGAYNVVVRYQGVPVAEKKIIIVEQYLTEKELLYQVSKKIAEKIREGMEQVAAEDSTAETPKKGTKKTKVPKFAFSSLKDANFEYEKDQQDVEVIYSLMQAVLEQRAINDHYAILERAPQALIRLAHESLYTADPNAKKLKPYTKQEYGLRTKYIDDKEPFRYSIALVGVDDTRFVEGKGAVKNGSERLYDQGNTKVGQESEGFLTRRSQLERPLMVAQFDTADFLVVIDRLEGTPVVTESPRPGDYYDTKYDAKAIKRTATVKVNARILNRDGQIMWMRNITGQASDLLLPEFAPPQQTWAEKK